LPHDRNAGLEMVSSIKSFGIEGIGGFSVTAECYMTNGLPSFDIVGLPDAAVKEARDRVRAAIKNSGLSFPVSRLTVNLAPADKKKAGTVYDLPILVGILAATGEVKPISEDCGFFGEISLLGDLREVRGALPMALCAERCGIKKLFVPEGNAAEAAFAQGIAVYPVKNVRQLLAHLSGGEQIVPVPGCEIIAQESNISDFAEVKGQENVKRALEVAAAGGHNVLLTGPPGAGKSMLAKRLPGILPDMSRAEILQTTEIHSVAGLTSGEKPLVSVRPFRSPHHSISAAALSGGAQLQPGEMSLSNNGVLFLDEFPEFHRDVIESLRQPLEDGVLTISRASGTVTYPSSFMMVCAMNPCRCGYYGSSRCHCTPTQIRKYYSKISGPILDRIDIIVEVPALAFDEINARAQGEESAAIKQRVNRARRVQEERFKDSGTASNARMKPAQMSEVCALSPDCEALMRAAYDTLGLTARSYDRILRVARTIADLAGEAEILPTHLAEAVQYRTYDMIEDEE